MDPRPRTTGARNRPAFLLSILALGTLALAFGSCGLNVTGDLSAKEGGDLSNPPAERAAPDEALISACGPGGEPAASIQRAPYLQQVTDRSALVMWTSTAGLPAEVSVTASNGRQIARSAATAEKVPGSAVQLVARLDGLEPGQIYCYQVEEGGQTTVPRRGFRTAPAPGDAVRFVAFGDSGEGGTDQIALRDQLATVPFDLILHTGDLAYDSGTRGEIETRVFGVYQWLLGSFPMFPTSGNHEYETENAAPFREAFALPENGGPAGRERWFSFDWGDVHFVALDTEMIGEEQAAWLEENLAANRRPWTIVYGHRPPFSSGQHGSDSAFRRLLVPILERHRVPLVLTGHDHNYERTHPQNGVVYVVTGGGGKGTRDVGRSDFTAFSDAVIHFVQVVVEGDTLSLHAIDGTGREFDSLVIRR